jgi:CheY-like chemotaxis protein
MRMDQDEYDVVIMDLNMPEMNGIDAMRHIRRKEREESLLLANSDAGFGSDTAGDGNSSSGSSSSSSSSSGSSSSSSSSSSASSSSNFMTFADAAAPSSSAAPRKPKTFIIAISAANDEFTLQEMYEAGADAFINKPFDFKLFDDTLRNLNASINEYQNSSKDNPDPSEQSLGSRSGSVMGGSVDAAAADEAPGEEPRIVELVDHEIE